MLRRSLPFLLLLLVAAGFIWRWSDPATSLGSTHSGGQAQQGSAGDNTSQGAAQANDTQPGSADPPPIRARPTQTYSVQIQGLDQQALAGTAYWIQLNDRLIQALQTQLLLAPGEIHRLGALNSQPFVDGQLQVSLDQGPEYFLWIECEGYHPQHWFVSKDGIPGSVDLEPCPPFEVELLDPDDGAVTAASIVITSSGTDARYLQLDWRERLVRRYFQQSAEPHSNGIATFQVLPPGEVFVWVQPRPPFGMVTRDAVTPEGRLSLRLSSSATLFGKITDEQDQPLEGVFFAAMTMDDRGVRSSVGDARTDSRGEFRNDAVSIQGESLIGIAYLEGYESKTVELPFLRPGQEYRVDLKLRQAAERSFLVESPEGLPLEGLVLEFAHTPYDWIPHSARVRDDGLATVPPVLVNEEDYFVNLYSSGTRVYRTRVRTAGPGDVVRIVVPGLGRFVGPHPDAPAEKYVEVTPQGPGTRTFRFDGPVPCPWLPAGPALLQVVDRAGNPDPLISIQIEPGEQEWPDLQPGGPSVRFSLALLQGETVRMYATGSGYAEERLGEVEDGTNSVTIPAPGLEFRLMSDQRGAWSLGALCSDGQDLDLGKLSWPNAGRIAVLATGPDQVGLPRTAVQVFSTSGAFLHQGSTGPYGSWVSEDLAPGAYLIRVSPRDGHGGPLPTQEHGIVLRAGERAEVRAVFQNALRLEIEAPEKLGAAWYGESISAEATSRARSDAQGTIHLPGAESAGEWCIWWPEPGELTALGGQLPRLTGRIQPMAPPAVRVDTPPDRSWAVQLLRSGRVLATAPVRAGASFSLSADLPEGYFLRWIDAQEVGPRIPVREVLAARSVSLEAPVRTESLRFQDELGRVVPAVLALLPDAGESALSDHLGELWLEPNWLDAMIRIDRAGFHPTEARAAPGAVIVLRRLAGPLRVQTPAQAKSARLVPLFELTVPLSFDRLVADAQDELDFGEVPAGEYLIEWLDEQGQVSVQKEIQLRSGNELIVDPN